MDIKDKISQVTANLTWRIVHEPGGSDIEITSDPWSRTHTIKVPTSGSEWRDIEYLHELAHARLAEHHHLLSTAYFVRGVSQEETAPLVNPIRIASDWFADALLMLWCPYEEAAEIREHVGYVARLMKHASGDIGDDPDMIYGGGLMFAQACRWLALPIEEVPKPCRPVSEILIGVNPDVPTVKKKRELINALAALTCDVRIHLAKDDSMELWRIKK